MSYLVLARKWRPQTFEDVTGQEHVVQTLANAIAQDRLAHAFLLCGPRGVGKTTTARLLARAMNCVEGPTATPCGVCVPCKEIVAGTSVDVVEIDGASNNGVESVRDLRESARYLPQRDRHKVFIIDEVHMLTTAAFNALLKTLEEPPPHVKFVFATTDPQKLPETILSRVQRHNFRRVPAVKMGERLRKIAEAEGIRISDHALGLIAGQADGGMRDALSLLDQLLASVGLEIDDAAAAEALGLVDRTVIHGLAEALVDRDGKRLVELLAGVHDRGIEPKRLCEELAQHLRDLIYVQAIGAAPSGGADVDAAALVELARRVDPAQLTRLFELVHGAIRELSFAAQPRLALEVALLSALHLAPSQGIAALAARLEAVAAGGGGGGPIPGQGDGREARGGGAAAPAGPRASENVRGSHAASGAAEAARGFQVGPGASGAAGGFQAASGTSGVSAAGAVSMGQGPGAPTPPADDEDWIGRFEEARTRAAPRQGGRRPAGRPAPMPDGDPDEDPGGWAASAPAPAPARERVPTPEQRAPIAARDRVPPPEWERVPPPDWEREPAPEWEREPAPEWEREPAPTQERVPPPEREREPAPTQQRVAPPEREREPAPVRDRVPPPEREWEPEPEPERFFPPEASPGGCATNECGEISEGDDPSLEIRERWRRFLESVRPDEPILYRMLAEGKLAWLRAGEIALGYTPGNAFHRANLEGPPREEAEKLLSSWFGVKMQLRLQEASEDAPASIAAENRELRAQREQRLRTEAREHPAVLQALSILGGEIDGIEVLEEG